MRVAHIGHSAGVGGIAVAIRESCLTLREQGCEVLLIGNGGALDAIRRAGVSTEVVDWHHRPSALARTVKTVRRTLRQFRPDVCHSHARLPSTASLCAGYYPDVYQLHSTGLLHRGSWMDLDWLRPWLPMGKHFMTLNPEASEWAVKHLRADPHNVHEVHHGIDVKYFRPPSGEERAAARQAFGLRPSDFGLFYVGRFHPSKQPDLVIELAVRLRSRGNPQVKTVLIGQGQLGQAIEQQIQQANLGDRCQVRPWMNPRVAYWASDLVVMPSRVEGFGLVAAEAMACQCRVLRSRTGGCAVMIRQGVTGFACEPAADDFCEKAIAIIEGQVDSSGVGVAARRHIEEFLSRESHGRRVMEVYRRIKGQSMGLSS